MSSRKSVIIDDVARLAGVSVPTVSRVLTGAAKVSADKRARVEAAIVELGFRPSTSARALAGGRVELVGVVTGDTTQYGYSHTIRGIELAASSASYVVMIEVVENSSPRAVKASLDALLSQPLAGVIVLQFDEPGAIALSLVPQDVPVVAVSGRTGLEVPQADIDETAAAEEITHYLLGLGHATVHHVAIPSADAENGRTIGWRNALRSHGIEPPPVISASWGPESGRSIGLRLSAREDVTAIFCGNDEIAMGLIRGLEMGGKRVPADVSVVGFDDQPLAQLWSPALTTVSQDFVGLGRRAFDLLMNRLTTGNPIERSTERPRLVIRDSAAAPPDAA